MQVGAGDVLRGQQQEEEEGQVGRCVTDELNEGLLDEVSQSALRCQQVDLRRGGGVEGVKAGRRHGRDARAQVGKERDEKD